MTEAQKEILNRYDKFDVITDRGTYFFLNRKRAEKVLKHNPKAVLRFLNGKLTEVEP